MQSTKSRLAYFDFIHYDLTVVADHGLHNFAPVVHAFPGRGIRIRANQVLVHLQAVRELDGFCCLAACKSLKTFWNTRR
jgi:hypothetical protein